MSPRRTINARCAAALSVVVAITLLASASVAVAASVPAPKPLAPANGAKVVVPFTIWWSAVSDPSGIVAYNWQVFVVVQPGDQARFNER